MKKNILYSFLLFCLILSSCKNKQSETKKGATKNDDDTLLEQIAEANGIDNWKKVNEINFTFNVDRDSTHFERSWKWWPKDDIVQMTNAKDTLEYTRKNMSSTEKKTDKNFINDKYWLLFPFQLVWDKGFDKTIEKNVTAPISNKKMTAITIAYNNEGGYTPGDAYKIYVNNNHMIREWEYHPGGSKEAKTTTIWEDYTDIKGVKIAKTHQNKAGDFKLYFTNVSIKQ